MGLFERLRKTSRPHAPSLASFDFLPWSVRLSMQCDKERLGAVDLRTLEREKFLNEAFYLTTKALDGMSEQEPFMEEAVDTLLSPSANGTGALNFVLRKYIARLPEGHKVDATKLLQISRQGPDMRNHLYQEVVLKAMHQGLTPVLVAYSPLYSLPSIINEVKTIPGARTIGIILPAAVEQGQEFIGYSIDLDQEKGQRVARMENSFPQRALLLDDVQVDDDDALSALRNNLQARFDMSIEIQALSHFIHRPTI